MNKRFFIVFISVIIVLFMNFKEYGMAPNTLGFGKAPFKISDIKACRKTTYNDYQIAVQQDHNAPIIYFLGPQIFGSILFETRSIFSSRVRLNAQDTEDILEACISKPTQNDLFEESLK